MAKILIVDDSMVARMSLKNCIPKDQGHELAEAKDGRSGLEVFRDMKPDVTFLDLTMPDINGLKVLEELRIDYPEALVIILTADVQRQTAEKIAAFNAFTMIKKPPVKEVVQEALAQALAVLEGRHV